MGRLFDAAHSYAVVEVEVAQHQDDKCNKCNKNPFFSRHETPLDVI